MAFLAGAFTIALASTIGAALAVTVAIAGTLGYRDETGRFHIVSDESQIPEKYRNNARHVEDPKPAQTTAKPATSANTTTATTPAEPVATNGAAPGAPIVIHSIDATSDHVVTVVTFGGSVMQKMIVDTGASLTTISVDTAKRLRLGSHGPVGLTGLQTASGVELFPIVRVSSVDASGAKVDDLAVVVNPHLSEMGLLGVDFLSQFNYSFDAGAETLTLSPLDPTPKPGSYGGHPEAWWKARYSALRAEIQRSRQVRARFNDEIASRNPDAKVESVFGTAMPARAVLAELDDTVRFWEQELTHFDDRAFKAGAPSESR